MATNTRKSKNSTPRKRRKQYQSHKHIHTTQLLVLLFICGMTLFLPGMHVYSSATPQKFPPSLTKLPLVLSSPNPFPMLKGETSVPISGAYASIIEDYESGAVFYEKNSTTPLPPASLIKLLTAMVALDYCSLDKQVQVTITAPLASDESRMGLVEGETITVENLLYGLLLPSGNDAAQTLAARCHPSDISFVQLMNIKAQSLGLTQTFVTNPTGQDEQGNITTAKDLAKLTRQFLVNPFLAQVVDTPYKTVFNTSGTIQHPLANTNVLLRQSNKVIGVKTGTTNAAGQNFIGLIKTNTANQKILVVLLSSYDRFPEVVRLEKWVLDHFVWKYPAPIPDFPDFD